MELTEREINEKISRWVGRECSCVTELDSDNLLQGIPQYTTYWGNCAMHHLGGLPTPYVTSDRCAIELLPVLAEKGFLPCLDRSDKWDFIVDSSKGSEYAWYSADTIAGAITAAMMDVVDSI